MAVSPVPGKSDQFGVSGWKTTAPFVQESVKFLSEGIEMKHRMKDGLGRARGIRRRTGIHENSRSTCFAGVRFGRASRFAALVFAALAVHAGSAFAQSQDIVIPSSLSELRGDHPSSSWEIGQIERSLLLPSAPLAVLQDPDQDDVTRPLPLGTGELSLVLNGVVIEGSTVYADEELAHLYEESLGTQIPLAEVFRIAERITAKYGNDGYILSRAIVPPQTISDGRVRIRVIEGFINEVRIEGEYGESQLLAAYAAKIRNSRPLHAEDMERYLLLLDDLPGIASEAVLSPAKDVPGASDLLITVSGKAVDGYARIDNRGTKFNGPGQLWFGANYNSLDGNHHRTSVKLVAAGKGAKELRNLEIDHERQLGTEGRKLHLQFLQTDSEPGHSLRDLNIVSKSRMIRIGYSDPRIRSRSRNLSLHADLVVRDSETTIFDNPLSRDRVRFLSFGALYDSADRFGGINQIGVNLDQGLGFLGASREGTTRLSREHARFDFTKARLTASRLQRLSGRFSLLASFVSQFSLSKLPASEEFGVGGERCGRAYDASEITGDHGACLLVEMRYGQSLDADSSRGYQLYGFFDIGGVWRKVPGALGKESASEFGRHRSALQCHRTVVRVSRGGLAADQRSRLKTD